MDIVTLGAAKAHANSHSTKVIDLSKYNGDISLNGFPDYMVPLGEWITQAKNGTYFTMSDGNTSSFWEDVTTKSRREYIIPSAKTSFNEVFVKYADNDCTIPLCIVFKFVTISNNKMIDKTIVFDRGSVNDTFVRINCISTEATLVEMTSL